MQTSDLNPDKNKRLALNTVFLSVRTVLTLFISLFTTRVLLEALGVRDFGLFNLVAGFVTIFSFLYGSIMSASLRFITYELGAGNEEGVRQTFSTSLAIHLVIAAIILAVGETAGVWFVNAKLNIEPENMFAANIVYQCAIASMILGVIQIPYSSLIMAYERMDVYAFIMLGQAGLRLLIAYMAYLFAGTHLIAYAFMYLIVSLIICLAYIIYCRINMNPCLGRPHFWKGISRSLITFAGFDTYGNICSVIRLQGANVILNWFGGTLLNAASAVATQVASALQSFSSTVVLAFKPQMTKEYAVGDYERVSSLMTNCSKYALLLVGSLMVPLFYRMDFILSLWLGADVPEWSVQFCRICVLICCFETITASTYAGIHATGRVAALSLTAGTLWLVELVAAYFMLRWTSFPPVVFFTHLIFITIVIGGNLVILRRQLPGFSWVRYVFRGLTLPVFCIGLSLAAGWYIGESIGIYPVWKLIIDCALSLTISGGALLIFDKPARKMVEAKLLKLKK